MRYAGNKEKSFTIGQAAEITGISRDRLRYYEENELLCPEQKEDNGYRYYTMSDIDMILSIEFYRSMNLSMKEIGNVWMSKNAGEIASILAEKEKDITTKIEEMKNYLINIKKGREACERIDKNLNQYSVQAMPAFEVIEEISDYRAFAEYEKIHKNRSELEGKSILHTIKRMITYSPKGIETDKILITRDISQNIAVVQNKMEYNKCIYTIVEDSIERGDILQEVFAKSIKWMNDNHLKGKGIAIINMILIGVNMGTAKSYLEVFAPIE